MYFKKWRVTIKKIINIRLTDNTLKAISRIYTDKVYVVAETNMKDGEKIKVTFFILGKNNESLVKVLRTTLVKNSQIIEEFNIPKILKEHDISKNRMQSLNAELEWHD